MDIPPAPVTKTLLPMLGFYQAGCQHTAHAKNRQCQYINVHAPCLCAHPRAMARARARATVWRRNESPRRGDFYCSILLMFLLALKKMKTTPLNITTHLFLVGSI